MDEAGALCQDAWRPRDKLERNYAQTNYNGSKNDSKIKRHLNSLLGGSGGCYTKTRKRLEHNCDQN